MGKPVPAVVVTYGREGEGSDQRVIEGASETVPSRAFGLTDPAAIFYTSGTTGFRKAR
jgi:acyl-coenzyme A synthetase/AMP-(fatty) acid ligase